VERAMFFIDGFNVYHSLIENRGFRKYLWLNYSALAKRKISGQYKLAGIYYFSAIATWRPDSLLRHRIFIEALKNENVQVVLGKFKTKAVYCKECNQYFKSREEKQTDVNIAVNLFKQAAFDNFDVAVLVTNDTDLIPVVKAVKDVYPQKKIGVLYPFGRWSSELHGACDFTKQTIEKDLASCQFPEKISLPSGNILKRPRSYS